MSGPHKARKAGPCDRCGGMIAAGDNYYAGKAKLFGWRTRFATERICVLCTVNNAAARIKSCRSRVGETA